METGNWKLATGNWQLATGNWQLQTKNNTANKRPQPPYDLLLPVLSKQP
jgi:hypothetical protein